jgi:hypothetical protein
LLADYLPIETVVDLTRKGISIGLVPSSGSKERQQTILNRFKFGLDQEHDSPILKKAPRRLTGGKHSRAHLKGFKYRQAKVL